MTGQALLLLSDCASYMTGGEYFVDGSVNFLFHSGLFSYLSFLFKRESDLVKWPHKIKSFIGIFCNFSVYYQVTCENELVAENGYRSYLRPSEIPSNLQKPVKMSPKEYRKQR